MLVYSCPVQLKRSLISWYLYLQQFISTFIPLSRGFYYFVTDKNGINDYNISSAQPGGPLGRKSLPMLADFALFEVREKSREIQNLD